MIKSKTVLEFKVEDRKYEMTCDPTAPLGELHDVLTRWKFYVLDRMMEEQKKDEQRFKPVEEINGSSQS